MFPHDKVGSELVNSIAEVRMNLVCQVWEHPRCGYGSIPIDTFLVGWTSIYQLFWGSLGTRVLTHPHVCFCLEIWYPNPQIDWFIIISQSSLLFCGHTPFSPTQLWWFPAGGTPKSSKSLDNFSIETHCFWVPPFMETPTLEPACQYWSLLSPKYGNMVLIQHVGTIFILCWYWSWDPQGICDLIPTPGTSVFKLQHLVKYVWSIFIAVVLNVDSYADLAETFVGTRWVRVSLLMFCLWHAKSTSQDYCNR